MVAAIQIKDHMQVVDSNGTEIATVDHMDGVKSIKLTKDQTGQHHWIPVEWVARVDTYVHLDRPGEHVIREWSEKAP
jgi:hypothetical protein